jgi:hypothetical protein
VITYDILRGIFFVVYVTTLLESHTQPFKCNVIGEWWTERIWKMFFLNDWDALSGDYVWGWGQLQVMPVFIGCGLANIRPEPLPNTSIKRYLFWGLLLAWWKLFRTGKHNMYSWGTWEMSTVYWSEVKGKKHLRSSRRGVDGEILLRLFIKGLDWIRLCRNRD